MIIFYSKIPYRDHNYEAQKYFRSFSIHGNSQTSTDKNIRIDLENQLKAQAERDGTLKKYVKATISPIENKPVIPKTDTEDLPNTGLVSKTPYRDITPYREEWHINPIDK